MNSLDIALGWGPWSRTVPVLLRAILVCGVAATAVAGAVNGPLATEAVVVVMAMGWAIGMLWRCPQWGAYALAVGYPLTAAMSRIPGIANLRPNELMLIAVLTILVLRAAVYRVSVPRLMWFDAAGMAMVFGGGLIPLVAVYLRHEPLLSTTVTYALGPAKNYAIFWTVRLAIGQVDHARRTISAVMLVSGVVGLVGIAQALHIGPVMRVLATYYPTVQVLSSESGLRITSVEGDWNGLGAYLCFTLLVGVAAAIVQLRVLPGLLFNSIIALDVLNLLLTGSIASTLGLLAGLLALGIFLGAGVWLRRFLVLLALSAATALVAFTPLVLARIDQQFGSGGSPFLPQSMESRIYLWKTYFLPAIARQPIVGIGLTIPASIPWTTTDSGYLGLLFAGGIVFLVSYLCFTWWVIRGARSLLRSQSLTSVNDRRTVVTATSAACLSIVLVLLGMNVSEAYYGYAAAAGVLWLTLGIAASIGQATG